MAIVPILLGTMAAANWHEPFADTVANTSGVAGVARIAGLAGLVIALVSLPTSFVLSFAALVVRFRGSRGEERLQLKWFVFAACLVAFVFTEEHGHLLIESEEASWMAAESLRGARRRGMALAGAPSPGAV